MRSGWPGPWRSDILLHVLIDDAAGGVEVEDRAVAEIVADRAGRGAAGRRRRSAPRRACRGWCRSGVGDQLRPGIAVAEAVVAQAQSIVGAGAERAVHRNLAVRAARRGAVAARICGLQTKLPERPRRPGDDIGDLAAEAGNVERRARRRSRSGRHWRALIRCSSVNTLVDLPEIRSPLISTLPVAWPRPRRSVSPPSIEKPGTLFSMSSALRGAKRAKSAGV